MSSQHLKRNKKNKDSLFAYLSLVPSGIFFAAFILCPAIYAIWLSLYQWDGLSIERPFVGIENYLVALKEPLFWKALGNSIYYTLVVVFSQMLIGLLLALALNEKLRARSLFRTVFFLPLATSTVVASSIWRWLLSPGEEGLVNYFLSFFGIKALGWLGDPKYAMLGVMLMSIWRWMGYHMVIYLAGLQSIPSELYEAAKIDGAGKTQQFFYVTWPMLYFTTFFLMATSIINGMQVFDEIYVMTRGGPVNSTEVTGLYIYQNAFHYYKMGYGSAVSCLLTLFILIFTIMQFRHQKQSFFYD